MYDIQRDFLKALREGNLTQLKELHLKNPHLYLMAGSQDQNYNSLFVACSEGYIEIIKWLISLGGIDIYKGDYFGVTNLQVAGAHNHKDVVELLLKEGYSAPDQIDTKTSYGLSAFFISCITDNLEVAKILLNAGADINCIIESGDSCLHIACNKAKIDTVKFLIQEGADKNLINKLGLTPMDLAKSHDRDDLIIELLRQN